MRLTLTLFAGAMALLCWEVWRSRRKVRRWQYPILPYPTHEIAPGVIEYDLSEPLGDVPALPEDEDHQLWEQQVIRRMDAIEEVGERDGWRCGVCHMPADHLYFIELHDDGALCCAVCAQILETGALE